MNKSIERQIKLIYNKVYKSVFTSSTIDLLSKGDTDSVNLILGKLQSSDLYNKFAERFSKELAKKGLANQRGIWRKYFEAAKQSHYIALPHTYTEFEKNIDTVIDAERSFKENFNRGEKDESGESKSNK